MKNRIESGAAMNFTLAATVASGDPVAVGTGFCGIAVNSGVSGDVIALALEGVFTVGKTTSLVITAGDKLYVNTGTKLVTKTNTDVAIGFAWTSQLSADTTVQVVLSKF